MNDTYVHVRLCDGRPRLTGTPSCTLGYPLPAGASAAPQGVFVEWRFDGERLTVRNDRYGFYPCFYFQREGEFCLSPSIFRLIAEGAPADLDYPALAAFFHLGHFVGEDTPFQHIRALPPNAVLTWHRGRASLSGGYFFAKPWVGKRDEAIDTFIHLFARAIERHAPPTDNFAVPLSGGKDSRHILLELCRQGRRPRFCLTMRAFPPLLDRDARLAPLVARAVGVDLHVLDQTEPYFETEARKNLLTNLQSDEHQWVLAMADFLRGRVDAVYDGLAGDVLSTCQILTPKKWHLLKSGAWADLAAEYFAFWRVGADVDNALAVLLGRCEAERLGYEVARSRAAEELLRHTGAPNPVVSFRFWDLDRREIALAPFGLLAEIPVVFAPYLDHDLFDFLSALPPEMVADHRLHVDTIRRAYPHCADLPFEEKKPLPLETAREQDAAFVRGLARWHLRRLPSRWLRNGFLLPRMLAALLSRRHALAHHWYAPVCLYLLQLERAAQGKMG